MLCLSHLALRVPEVRAHLLRVFSGQVNEIVSCGLRAIVPPETTRRAALRFCPAVRLIPVLSCLGERAMGERRGVERTMGERRGVSISFSLLKHKSHVYLRCALGYFNTWAQCVMFKSGQKLIYLDIYQLFTLQMF